MTLHVKDGGVWRTVDDPQVRVSGAWQPIQEGWVRVAGVWRQFYSRISVSLATLDGSNRSSFGFTTSGSPITVTQGIKFETDGTLQARDSTSPFGFFDLASGEWIGSQPNPGIGSSYKVKLTVNIGSSPTSGPTVGVFHTISSDRQWDLSVTGTNASASGNWTVEIQDVATSTTRATATFGLNVTVSTI